MYSRACDSLLSISVSIPQCIQNSIAFPLQAFDEKAWAWVSRNGNYQGCCVQLGDGQGLISTDGSKVRIAIT